MTQLYLHPCCYFYHGSDNHTSCSAYLDPRSTSMSAGQATI